MRFVYGRQDAATLAQAEKSGFLLTNGLGGYMALTAAFSVNRADAGVLVGTRVAPNDRFTLVHRLRETLETGDEQVFLSSQAFADDTPEEDGYRVLSSFVSEHGARWTYQTGGIQVTREAAMGWEENAAALVYTIENRTDRPAVLRVTPFLKFAPKENALEKKKPFTFECGRVTSDGQPIAQFKREHMAPGEMEKITIPRVLLDRCGGKMEITVEDGAEGK